MLSTMLCDEEHARFYRAAVQLRLEFQWIDKYYMIEETVDEARQRVMAGKPYREVQAAMKHASLSR